MNTETDHKVDSAQEFNEIVNSATKCIDRGVDPESGKRGMCHIFLDSSNVCECGDIDLAKERLR